jgi:hypothetical protein
VVVRNKRVLPQFESEASLCKIVTDIPQNSSQPSDVQRVKPKCKMKEKKKSSGAQNTSENYL